MKKITLLSMVIILSLLVQANTVASILDQPSSSTTDPQVDVEPNADIKLVIATRHDSIIYNKFIDEFVKSSYGAAAGITSASQVKIQAPTTYDGFYKVMTNPFFEADIGWGGGPTLFNTLQKDGALGKINDTATLAAINEAVNDTIAGAAMKSYGDDGELYWAANAISSFGFTVNHKELEKRGLPVPRTWEDLASEDFFTSTSEANIGLGNAPDTTSNTRVYQIIFQKYGWERGWQIINGMAGNGQIYRGSVETRQSVISGETAVAMTIDFYGLIAQSENPDTEYIVPENASIVNGDPMALAANPAHPVAANEFMKFAFSKEGQALWLDTKINRLPVRPDAFDTPLGQTRPDIKSLYDKTLSNQGIQFNETLSSSIEEAMRYLWEASITDVHESLRATWGRIMNSWKKDAFTVNRYNELIEAMGKPPISMEDIAKINDQIISDPEFRTQKIAEWSAFALEKFDGVDELRTQPEVIGNTTISVSSVENTVQNVPFLTSVSFMAIATIGIIRRKRNKL